MTPELRQKITDELAMRNQGGIWLSFLIVGIIACSQLGPLYRLPLFIGFLVLAFFAGRALHNHQAQECVGKSDDVLQAEYGAYSAATKEKARQKQIWIIALIAAAMLLYATNPDEKKLATHVGTSAALYKRKNMLLFSVYESRIGRTQYLAILNNFHELNAK